MPFVIPNDAPHWLRDFAREIERQIEAARTLDTYTVATLPDATAFPRLTIYVSDETGGAVPAFSDGTNWRRVTDRTIVS